MDINVTTRNLKKNKIFLFLFIKYTKKKITMVVTAMDINVTLNNIKKNPKLLILET